MVLTDLHNQHMHITEPTINKCDVLSCGAQYNVFCEHRLNPRAQYGRLRAGGVKLVPDASCVGECGRAGHDVVFANNVVSEQSVRLLNCSPRFSKRHCDATIMLYHYV
jgi:hypothetical protein